MQLPVTIGLHRSLFLGIVLAVLHGLAAVLMVLTPWSAGWKSALLLSLGASAILSWHLWPPKAAALRLHRDGSLECRLAGNEIFIAAEVLPEARVHPWLTVMGLDLGEGRIVVFVLPDSTGSEDFRRLRLWLRWRAGLSARRDAA